MTLDRLEELHTETVFTQEQCRNAFDISPNSEAAGWEMIQPVTYSHHESHIRAHMNATKAHCELQLGAFGQDALLEEHYLRGGPHPHDYKLPLNMWEDVSD